MSLKLTTFTTFIHCLCSDVGLLTQLFIDYPMASYNILLKATNGIGKTGTIQKLCLLWQENPE